MPYDNTPGVKGSFIDGALKTPRGSDQPLILVVGPASKGRTDERFLVTNSAAAEKEFGSSSAVMRGVHEALAQGANNVAVMRSGGRPGEFVFTDSAGETLTIVPESRDDAILSRYALVIEDNSGKNRILVYDLTDEQWVYDSSEILVLDEGVVSVVDSGIDLFTVNSSSTPDSATDLASLVTGDFTAVGTATAASLTQTNGTDGGSPSRVEAYAALNSTYHVLDFKDGDMVVPMDVYIDDSNIVELLRDSETNATSFGLFHLGIPAAGAGNDALGYLWQYVYRGRLYTYMVDSDSYFADLGSAAAATITVDTDIVLTAAVAGKGGNGISIEIDVTGAAGPTVTVTENGQLLEILVTDDGSATRTDVVSAISSALTSTLLTSGAAASTVVTASGGSGTSVGAVAKTSLAGGTGGAVLTHEDLTGDSIPAAVSTRFAAGVDAELRECNFAHQLASFCSLASQNWKALLGCISTKAPTAFDRGTVADWVGSLPVFSDNGQQKYIASTADNGAGLLGLKLLAGESAAAGYRAGAVNDGDANDSLAYGGLIMTKGASLPNGKDWPYGVDSADEKTDANGAAVDIGKHILVSSAWPIHSNSWNGGSTYRGAIPASILGLIATLPENVEPIGDVGRIARVKSTPRIHSTQLDELNSLRIINLRREEGTGLFLTTSKTAAHPDSDYSRLSTIRSVNKHLEGVRAIAKPYIGKAFSSSSLVSLQSAVDQYLAAQQTEGFNQGARASLSYTRTDKIMGRLTIRLKMVPPFTIDTITVETTLAADESEL